MFRRRRSDKDFAAEIQSHLDLEQDALRAQGVAEAAARTAARRAFGNPTAAQERFHEHGRWLWRDHFLQDLRFAARTLARSPGFAAAPILTLALGIGANTAIFSAIDDALFRPFRLPHPQELAQVYSFDKQSARFVSSSYRDYEDFRSGARAFRQLAAYVRLPLAVTFREHTELVTVEAVTGNYFDMLELPPLVGRTFRAEDDAPGAAPAALISETLWRDRFGSTPSILGQSITIEDHPFRIVGVVPRRYTGINLNWDEAPLAWIPLHLSPLVVPGFGTADVFRRRDAQWLVITGRLNPGYSLAAAQAELQTLATSFARSEPADRYLTAVAYELSRSKFWPSYRRTVSLTLLVFAVAAGLVLLLACANVSNLLLQRALRRRREFAIRLALGARRGRLLRQLLTENFLLAAPGFVLAIAIAQGFGKMLRSFPGALGLPLMLDLSIDGRVLAFCALVSLAALLLFGLVPALQAAGLGVPPALQNASAISGSRDRLRQALVVVQVALCVTLLMGGSLLGRTLLEAYRADPGFRPAHLLFIEFNVPQTVVRSLTRVRAFEEVLPRRMASLPGVESAAIADEPLVPARLKVSINNEMAAEWSKSGPGGLRTLGIPMVRGREFDWDDRDNSPPVVVVNQALAARLAPGGDAVGRTIRVGSGPPVQVVGVVADSKYHTVWDAPQPHLYQPLLQVRPISPAVAVRTRGRPEELISTIRRQWDQLAPGVQLVGIHTGAEQIEHSLAPQRAAAALLGGFALLALMLAFIGLFSAMTCSVTERTREIGIRVALGARPETIVRRVMAKALSLTAAGIGVSLPLSLVLARLLASEIPNLSSSNTASFAAVGIAAVSILAAAAWLPARRAARVDPVRTLRCE